MSERRELTIADALPGRTQVTPLMKITAGQRLYYNYHFDQPSLDRELATVHARGLNGPSVGRPRKQQVSVKDDQTIDEPVD